MVAPSAVWVSNPGSTGASREQYSIHRSLTIGFKGTQDLFIFNPYKSFSTMESSAS
jgi:hypothetical protein